MTFLMAAGGTGGHVIPGIEVARQLRRRGHTCVFVGTRRGQEARLVPAAGFSIRFLQTGALKGLSLLERLRTLVRMPLSLLAAQSVLNGDSPAAVLSLGGYASGPVMLMSLIREIPVLIMEPNARPGLANRLAGPFASYALVGFPQAQRYFVGARSEVSGIPIREEFFAVPPRRERRPFTILITGGSQGARRLNRAAREALAIWSNQDSLRGLRIIHQTGAREYNEFQSVYGACQADARVAPFFEDMAGVFACADVVICRAGASAVAELRAAGKASILVPYPHASDQHQLVNALAQQEAGAGRMVPDAKLSGERLVEEVERLRNDHALLEGMEASAKRLSRAGAAERAAVLLEELAARHGRN
jgi:UDP-N-acetylglucosamine--N-acetylmuramyl-(pentapeptide) pyrophosphoryl-undecaprenol N-acetylglucosamine transferase